MALNEQETKARFIGPALDAAGWSLSLVSQEESTGRVDSAGDWSSGTADYLLHVVIDGKKEIAAVLEAKAASKSPESGARQAREYARSSGAPFAFATNGHVFVEVGEDGKSGERRKLSDFPSPTQMRDMHPIERKRQAQLRTKREARQRHEREVKRRHEKESHRREREVIRRRTPASKSIEGYQVRHNRASEEIWRDEAEQLRQDLERQHGVERPDLQASNSQVRQREEQAASADRRADTQYASPRVRKDHRQPELENLSDSTSVDSSVVLERSQAAKRQSRGSDAWRKALQALGSIRAARGRLMRGR